jgi:uncharacterized membrane protein YbjE (DUF340 family)
MEYSTKRRRVFASMMDPTQYIEMSVTLVDAATIGYCCNGPSSIVAITTTMMILLFPVGIDVGPERI